MKIFTLPAVFSLLSCAAIHEASDKIEASHYSLYSQKILLVTSLEKRRIIFTNPANTQYFYLKGKKYISQWQPGDTFVIDDNLENLYKLKYLKNP